MSKRFEIKVVEKNVENNIGLEFIETHGCYYVAANPGKENTYYGYLHRDGTIHVGTLNNKTSEYNGWYKTRKAAQAAIKLYRNGA